MKKVLAIIGATLSPLIILIILFSNGFFAGLLTILGIFGLLSIGFVSALSVDYLINLYDHRTSLDRPHAQRNKGNAKENQKRA